MPTYIISGKTFDHRETLKNLGAKYDGDSKAWTLRNPSTDTLSLALNLSGVTVRDQDGPAGVTPRAAEPARSVSGPSSSETFGGKVTRENGKVYVGKTREYESLFCGDASFYAEFLSISELLAFTETTPDEVRYGTNDRNAGFNTDPKWSKLFGTASMPEAIALVANGWSEGVAIAREVSDLLTGAISVRRRRANVVAGGTVNVGRMLAGNPVHMRARVRQPANKVITLVNDLAFPGGISAKAIGVRAGIFAAVADELENNGYSCEILNVTRSIAGAGNFVTVSRIKTAGEKLNITDAMFALGHPSFQRRFMFNVKNHVAEFASAYSNQGTPGKLDTDTLPNTYLFNKLNRDVTGNTTLDMIRQIAPKIVPANLPVQFNL